MLFITSNLGKLAEVQALFPSVKSLGLNLPEIQDLNPHEVISQKLLYAASLGHDNILVEDTSLCLACLNGLPGTLIKWFLNELGADGIADLVSRYPSKEATARTTFGLLRKGHKFFSSHEIEGQITKPRGTSGFGWDSIFKPNGSDLTFAEMQPVQKQAFSMRTIAFKRLLDAISTSITK